MEVIQGGYGSCYLLSSLQSLLYRDNKFIEKLLQVRNDRYFVSFYLRSKFCWRIKRKTIEVYGDLPTGHSKPETIGIIEKCYGEFIGGMHNYERGGYPWVALYDITGKQPELTYSTSENFKSTLLANPGAVMVADSKGADLMPERHFIVPRHSYAIFSVDESGVVLRNPWGQYEPVGDGVDDGVFKISWDYFIRCFIRVSYLK